MRFNANSTFRDIPTTEPNRIAIIRDPIHFSVDTEDNPDMVHTLKTWRHQAISLREKNACRTDDSIETFISKYITGMQQQLKQRCIKQHAGLISILKKYNILYFALAPEKHVDSNANKRKYCTDETFATDTGVFYFKDDVIHFIHGNFHNQQRIGEERLAIVQAKNALQAQIHTLQDTTTHVSLKLEGGDIRQAPGRRLFFAGYGYRNDINVPSKIEEISGFPVVKIKLLQDKFYHLDCCFLPLPNDTALIYEGVYLTDKRGEIVMEPSIPQQPGSTPWPKIRPGTATMCPAGRAAIRQLYDNEHLILLTEDEANKFATNAALFHADKNGGCQLLLVPANAMSAQTKQSVTTLAHVIIHEVPFDAFHTSGGSVRCAIQEIPCSLALIKRLVHRQQPGSHLTYPECVMFPKPKSPMATGHPIQCGSEMALRASIK